MYKTYVTKIIVNNFLCINLFKEHSKFVLQNSLLMNTLFIVICSIKRYNYFRDVF